MTDVVIQDKPRADRGAERTERAALHPTSSHSRWTEEQSPATFCGPDVI
jgi:hypothetical protein